MPASSTGGPARIGHIHIGFVVPVTCTTVGLEGVVDTTRTGTGIHTDTTTDAGIGTDPRPGRGNSGLVAADRPKY